MNVFSFRLQGKLILGGQASFVVFRRDYEFGHSHIGADRSVGFDVWRNSSVSTRLRIRLIHAQVAFESVARGIQPPAPLGEPFR